MVLLSIDWDYFISTENQSIVSTVENQRTIVDLWYKRYFQQQSFGKDIQNAYQLSKEVDDFWKKIKGFFQFAKETKVYVSDSHALSYKIAENYNVNEVYLFDAHSDLGYGGLESLQFEVNCANWLGKLLSNEKIEKAHIIYSPYTKEKKEEFKEINERFNVNYLKFNELPIGIKTSVVHICRSGAWSPPWFDKQFVKFIHNIGLPLKIFNCQIRKWNPRNISFSEQIQYFMS